MKESLSLVSVGDKNGDAKKGSNLPSSVTTTTTATNDAAAAPLDFIGSSGAVKDLFSLPYSVHRPISVAVHNLGGTLLLDAEPDEEAIAKAALKEQLPLPSKKGEEQEEEKEGVTLSLVALSSLDSADTQSEALMFVNNLMIQQSSASSSQSLPKQGDGVTPHPDDYVANYMPTTPIPREYLSWKFHDMNLLVGSDALIYRSGPAETSTALTVRVEDAVKMKAMVQQHEATVQSGTFVADHQHERLQQTGKPSYAEAARRKSLLNKNEEEDESKSATIKSFAVPDLDRVQLQSCIVPVSNESIGSLMRTNDTEVLQRPEASNRETPSPVSTVLDTYLDNIMANVPQLALCLREKGFIQSVKLLNTDELPSQLMQSRTYDTSVPFENIRNDLNDPAEEIFSPQIMEMNAHALLRFLKTHCTKDNATYLLRRESGRTNIQLYDISSISAQRQQKWIWWLAMMSYRFSNRLGHLSSVQTDKALRRSFRARQRSLLINTLELLEMLADMGHVHESLIAAVCENLADTFLTPADEDEPVAAIGLQTTKVASPIAPPPQAVSSHQPYVNVSVDALGKAQDNLAYGIKMLHSILNERLKESKRSGPFNDTAGETGTSDKCSDASGSDDEKDEELNEGTGPVVTQLVGLHLKLINVSLRLAEIHLKNYWSSSAMHNLRTSANRISDSLRLVGFLNDENDARSRVPRLQLQYAWLWEQCGHFARSFAADGLWRERGHASGDDVVTTLQDVEAAFLNAEGSESNCDSRLDQFARTPVSLADSLNGGVISLQSLSGLVNVASKNAPANACSESSSAETGLEAAKKRLENQNELQRDERKVLVAASLAYYRAVLVFDEYLSQTQEDSDKSLVELLRQRFGDACNETGKVMLDELRRLLVERPNDESVSPTADALCSSAEFWFNEGLHAFEASHDLRNLALLRCNLCQCCKLRANNVFASSVSTREPPHAESCLQEAANHLERAHEALETREVDPVTWDMVSAELAATFLVLGVRRRQSVVGSGTDPLILQALRLSPGKERSIVDPMERALTIYEELGNLPQAAAAHYQLALFYSKIWTCQRDEVKTREKLSAAFNHFQAAYAFYAHTLRGNELTFCLLCLDLATLLSSVPGEEGLSKALLRCLDTASAFSDKAMDAAAAEIGKRHEWFKQMDTIASSVEERVFRLLKNLVKLEQSGSLDYKELYRTGLTAKMSPSAPSSATGDPEIDAVAGRLTALRKVMEAIRQLYDRQKMK